MKPTPCEQFARVALPPAGACEAVLYLGSASPRRRELLVPLAGAYTLLPLNVDEGVDPSLPPVTQAEKIAVRKALAGHAVKPRGFVLTADTVVALDGAVYGKPRDRADAAQMLRRLSGRTHQVITGVALCMADGYLLGHSITDVTFREIAERELQWYLDTDEWKDKAGGYGVQGMASVFTARIEGSLSNVIGLPEGLVRTMLQESGYEQMREAQQH